MNREPLARLPPGARDALPLLIQGGMGVGVSHWPLARAVASRGHLGVVSGALIDTMLVRRLQLGDPDGHIRRAMHHFPMPGVAEEVLRRYFVAGGLRPETPFRLLSMWGQRVSAFREQLTALAAFVEVWLAREGHDGPVGLNLLTKLQLPNMATLYGAMLAGVHVVIMGAGIPREIPGVLDRLARHEPASLKFDVEHLSTVRQEFLRFDPARLWKAPAPLSRPRFLAIVSSNVLATTLARKSTGRVDGFVVEGPTAGGHNAPPRGDITLDRSGAPIYGDRDVVDLAKLRALGLPFWLAGGMGSPRALSGALTAGAAGVQVGTLFAFCEESGIEPALKARILAAVDRGEVEVRTDAKASPTGYPFKSLHLQPDLLGASLEARTRICDLGYLRTAYESGDGSIRYRCPAEPIGSWVAGGGEPHAVVDRRCLCNGLLATVGLGQWRHGDGREPPVVTAGSDLADLRALLAGRPGYTAAEAIDWILAGRAVTAPAQAG